MLTLTQVGGALLIFTLGPWLGALPLAGWLTQLLAHNPPVPGRKAQMGVTTAFQEGGAIAGSLALVLEAAKGILAVLLARYFFPTDPTWEIVALIALVMGRYWSAQAVGTTSVIWGSIIHAPITAGLTFLISFLGFTIFREKHQGRLLVLILFPLITLLRYAAGAQVLAMACLCGLIAWIYQKVPEDLEIPTTATRLESQRQFGLFRRDRALHSLDYPLSGDRFGSKAAILSQLLAWGYPVPKGYVLPAGDDPAVLIDITCPTAQSPVIVRASVVGDQPLIASGAGQYPAISHLTSQEVLFAAIQQCFRGYDRPGAGQYRRDRALPATQLAVIVQQQVPALGGGVACSRNPLTGRGDIVIVEGLLGSPQAVVSGQQTPEHYQVTLLASDLATDRHEPESWQLPEALCLPVYGSGDLPSRLIQQVAYLARHLEARYRGRPQVLEWSFDGSCLWVLQCRPLTPPLPRSGPSLSTLPGTPLAINQPFPPEPPLQGLAVSPGQVIGQVVSLDTWSEAASLPDHCILQVPFLNATQIPRLAAISGLIALAGGQLSHGAILAREYGIPTVILPSAPHQWLPVGQQVLLDGAQGTLTRLSSQQA